jgi:hypothetical protein
MLLIPSQRLNKLSREIIQMSVAHAFSDAELLIVVTYLQDHLLGEDRPLRAVIGSLVNTADDDLRGRFLNDLIGIAGESSSIH